MYILLFTFIVSILHSREISITTFCIVEKTLHLLHPFRGYIGALGCSKAGGKFKSGPVFIDVLPLGSQARGCYGVYYS